MIMISVWGLKYVPGRRVSSSSWKRRALVIAALYPTAWPTRSRVELLQRAGDLGVHIERLEALTLAALVARDHQLAHLLHQARLVGVRAARWGEQPRDLGVDVERRLAAADQPLAARAQHL